MNTPRHHRIRAALPVVALVAADLLALAAVTLIVVVGRIG